MALVSGVAWQWLVQSLMILFLVVAIAGLAVGIGLVVATPKTLEIFRVMNHWVSTRHALKSVELPRDSERITHKYHRWVAGGFVIGGLLSVVGLIAGLDVQATSAALAKGNMVSLAALGLQTLKWSLIVGSAFGVVVGGMLLFYPNAESTLEKFANQWVSSRRVVRSWDDMHMTLDRLVEAHPGPAGWIIGCTSAAAVVYAIVALARGH